MYFLIDANLVAGYYLTRSLRSKKAAKRIESIIDYIRLHKDEHFIYIPNICIAEVVNVFIKYSYAKWNKKINGKKTIDSRIYKSLIDSFHNDIHNGKFMYHYELNRYHILGVNLVAPIDHHYKYSSKKNCRPMGTFDYLIMSMGIHLAHIHGRNNVCILSADTRMTDILKKCKSSIDNTIIKKLKLNIAKDVCGKAFSKELFPKHLNLKDCKNSDLIEIFGKWPLNIGKSKNKIYRYTG